MARLQRTDLLPTVLLDWLRREVQQAIAERIRHTLRTLYPASVVA